MKTNENSQLNIKMAKLKEQTKSLDGPNSKFKMAYDRISKFEDESTEIMKYQAMKRIMIENY